MKKYLALSWVLFLLGFVCLAQAQLPLTHGGKGAPGGGAAYSGPGDVVSGAKVWYGLRAYSLATTGNNAIDLIRSSDSATCTGVKTLSNGNLDVSVSTAYCSTSQTVTNFCNGDTCKATKIYDQTAAGNCGGSCDMSFGSGNRPVFLVSCVNSLPCMQASGSDFGLVTGFGTFAQPNTFSMVAKRTGSFTSFGAIVGTNNESVYFSNSTNTWVMGGGGNNLTATASDSNWHAAQAIYNGVSSDFYIDGSSTTGDSGSANASGSIILFDDNFGTLMPAGQVVEAGMWNSAFDSTQKSNMNSNQHSYWGF